VNNSILKLALYLLNDLMPNNLAIWPYIELALHLKK